MNSQEELLSFLDLLDLDEEMIDNRLKSIMVKCNYTNQHLTNALQLLRYKHLINMQENTECSNEDEFDFVAKLIKDISADTVDSVCRITNTVLQLNTTKLVSYSEHLLLQILSNIDLSSEKSNALLYLKVCDSVLDAATKQGAKLSMVFLEASLEEIISSGDEQLKIHFITNSVPKLIEGIHGYDILSRIWNYLEKLREDCKSTVLKVLSSLSDFYLPIARNAKYESTLVYNHYFWHVIVYGLISDDPSQRKIAVYLAKRAIDYVSSLKANINVKFDNLTLFTWDRRKHDLYKNQWDNFFILIDSLEEKQSNIVMPSLQLFETLTEIDHSWLNCAYNLGLRHDNGQVRLKCVEQRIKSNIKSDSEAAALLAALGDINFYENTQECTSLLEKLSGLLKNESNLIYILKAIPHAHLSPVPFYYLSHVIANLDVAINSNKDFNVTQVIIDILKASCNVITIREAIHYNIAHFVGKSCKHLHWKEIASIYVIMQSETWTIKRTHNAIHMLISGWELDERNKKEFYKYVTKSHSNIDIGLLYLDNHFEDINIFIEILEEKLKTIQDVVNRQYSDKMESFNEVLYILNLQWKHNKNLKQFLPKAYKTILHYIYCLLTCDITLTVDESKAVFNSIHFEQEDDLKEIVSQLYKTSVILLQDPQTDLNKMVQSMLIVSCLTYNNDFVSNFSHEMLDLKHLLQFEATFKKKAVSNAQSLGRLRNVFYEIHCKVIFKYLEKEDCYNFNKIHKDVKKPNHLKETIDYVVKVVECGGYGCLEWILKIINKTFDYSNSYLKITQFLHRMWIEIEELKSSNQYLPCMMEFVKVITQRNLINKPEYNNLVILYCSKIIEYGFINNSPLYYLVDNDQLCCFIDKGNREKNKNEHGHLVYILSEILLFCPVPRKDQRIADNLTLSILKSFGKESDNAELRFDFTIQYKALCKLSRIDDATILQALASFMTSKIDNMFKTKLRYHGNSQIHRTFQTASQHLLYILFLKLYVDSTYSDSMCDWCIELLGRLPHQPSVRILLEWHITLHFYKKKININEDILHLLQSKKVPLTSQLTIIYWLLKRKLANSTPKDEFEFVMDTLLSHTMGQMFNIRLLAQYLATKLYKNPSALNIVQNNQKYDYILHVIQKTLNDNAKDKNFIKMKEDYFMNDFDIVTNLTPFFIYYTLPRLCEVGNNEAVDTKLVLKWMEDINKNTEQSLNQVFREEWVMNHRRDEEFVKLDLKRRVDKKIQEDFEALVTIQKKYIPWKSMNDINVYKVDKKRESPSDLIVVASLIDKLPNLGGMARTSEVFGVRTYVIDSLRHVQDRQFQGLSVSAERWIDIEEVRPGPPLKEYLNRKKGEGYSVVAAEQTSTSSKLQTFKFPRKTLLLLGHEKDGVPCDLLPMMDHCVEIPQQGFVRSLNVHVTAAIFIWEYARQNLL